MPENNILIADDDRGVLDLLSDILQYEGYRVFLTPDGKEAVEVTKKTPIDVAILDWKMPIMDGLETLKEIKAIDPDIEVLIMTAYGDIESLNQILDHGAFDYILKPFHRTEITHTVQNALIRRGFVLENNRMRQELIDRIAQLERDFEERTRQLRESQIKYKQIVENSKDAIAVTQDEKIRFVNSKMLMLTGYTQEEILNAPFVNLIHPDDHDMVEASHLSAMKGEEVPDTYTFRLLKKGRESFWAEINVIKTTWEEQPATLSFIRDITERKLVEEELRRQRDRAEKYLDVAGVIVVVVGADQRVVLINRKGCEVLGYRQEEIIGKKWFDDFLPERIRDEAKSVFGKLMAGEIEPAEYYENSVLNKSGQERIIAWHHTVLRDEAGDTIATLSSGEDITERKLAEDKMRFQAQLLDSVRESIVATDLEGHVVYWGKGAEVIYGYSPEEVMGKEITFIVKPEEEEEEKERMRQVIETGSWCGQYVQQRKDGSSFWADIFISLVTDESGRPWGLIGIDRDISDQMRAEEALRESEKRYRELFEQSRDPIYITYREGKPVAVNRSFLDLFGYTPEEIMDLKAQDVYVNPDDRPRFQREIEQSGSVRDFEVKLRKKDGTEMDSLLTASLRRNDDGSILGYQGIIRDITEHKRADEELKKSEERFRTVFEAAPLGIAIANPEGRFLEVNDFFYEMLGYTKDEVMNMTFVDITYPDDREETIRLAEEVREGKRNFYETEKRYLRKDSRPVWAIVRASVIRDSNSEIKYWLGIMQDISANKQAEEALRESEEKYRLLVENSHEAILVAKDGMLRFVNSRAIELSGYSEEELKSRPFVDFIHPDDREMVIQNHLKRLRGESLPPVYPFRIVRKDGNTRWVEISAVLISWEGGPAALNFLSDITEKRQMEEELQKADKLESIGILAGGIAHDFNNILAVIVGSVSLAKMDARPGDKVFELLEEAERASARAKDLTQQLLTFSKGGAPVKKMASIAEIIEESSKFALRGSRVRCDFNIPVDLWSAEIDVGQINQVIHNLILNADQAMPTGGVINVRAENIVIDITHGLPLEPGRYLNISIQDRGIGIPEEHLLKIFDPYFSTKQKGNGLGLTTAYSIIKRHGGHITVESQLGIGTTFHIYLPTSEKVISKRKKKKGALQEGHGKVLLMDDEENVRKVAGRMLKKLGYEVEFAGDGAEAIELYKKAKESGKPFDVVIMDLTVPGGMGGLEAIRTLREIDPHAKAIVSSGYSTDPIMSNFREHGFCGVAPKPYKLDELGRILNEVIKGED